MSENKVRTHRRALHQIPEIGDQLPKTKEYLYKVLSNLDCQITEYMDSGLLAFFDKGKGQTIGFRADMDGLMVEEATGADYTSTHTGQMHACGHDGHMAVALTLAEYVSSADLNYNVLIIFQPAEELVIGALEAIKTGLIKETNTKAIFGLHMWPYLDQGVMATRPGPIMAISAELSGEVKGKKAHAAYAEEGIDSIETLVNMMSDFYSMPKDGIFRVGVVKGGTVRNVVSDYAMFEGTMRSFSEESMDQMKAQVEEICKKWEEKTGASITVEANVGCPPVINNVELYKEMEDFFKENRVEILEKPSYASEDFSYYGKEVPAIFFFLGTGNGISLHNEKFNYDESVLESGLDLFKKILDLDIWREDQ